MQVLLREMGQAKTAEHRLDIIAKLQKDQQSRLAIQNTLKEIAEKLGDSKAMIMPTGSPQPNEKVDRCYEKVVDAYMGSCTLYRGNDYRFKDMHVFENLCRNGHDAEDIKTAISNACQK